MEKFSTFFEKIHALPEAKRFLIAGVALFIAGIAVVTGLGSSLSSRLSDLSIPVINSGEQSQPASIEVAGQTVGSPVSGIKDMIESVGKMTVGTPNPEGGDVLTNSFHKITGFLSPAASVFSETARDIGSFVYDSLKNISFGGIFSRTVNE